MMNSLGIAERINMYTVSFRQLVASVHGQNLYVNGSAYSYSPLVAGHRIQVSRNGAATPHFAEVIESVPTSRTPYDYNWTIR